VDNTGRIWAFIIGALSFDTHITTSSSVNEGINMKMQST
jgi:hypothetical protein